uniref:Cadherin domain-containing protein n=2 Tax=Tetranychus urticae TaxID=32264 RepID=T1KWL6_TETUR
MKSTKQSVVGLIFNSLVSSTSSLVSIWIILSLLSSPPPPIVPNSSLFSLGFFTIVLTCTASPSSVPNSHADNNFPPRFTSTGSSLGSGSEIVIRVKEGPSSLGKEIYRLTGEDPDGDPLTFGVLGTFGEDILKIENVKPSQAIIYLRKELDRETRDSYSLVLTLTDGKLGKGNYITKSMLIIVEDINDNEPVFRPFRTTVSLSEKSRPGIIETVEAFDQDEGRFGQVLYQLQEIDKENNGPKTFSIETVEGKGVISLVGDLDYERRSLYQLKILAIDRAIEGDRHTATATLLVRVEDAEDNPPIFTFVPSVTRIPENLSPGSEVLRVIAVDGDRGVNNAVTYRIVRGGQGHFTINPSTGTVTVESPLDREESIRRGSANSAYILEIAATEVTVAVFPPPSVSTEVTIILTDVNDEKPTFKSESYTVEISENAQADMPVKFIGTGDVPQVYDYDQGTNGTFTLTLEGDSASIFEVTPSEAINEATFVIRVKDPSSLDYETTKSLTINLVAREKAFSTESRSSTVPVTVHVKDANDNFPTFDRELYRASIPENAVKGAIVTQLKATDVDSGNYGTAGIRYTELSGELASKLSLDQMTGIITLATSEHGLDRETLAQYYITGEARDNEGTGNRNTVQIFLTIEDVNDNKPRFMEDRYEARIYENEVSFVSPVILRAIDADAQGTPNSQVRYSIVDGIYKDNFTIDARSGRLKVKDPLDFERIKQPMGETKNISLVIRASDLGSPSLFSDTELTVIVYDKNDHSPIFQRSSYAKSIPEDIRDGSMVVQVKAIDGDHSPTNSRVFYRISSGSQDKFVIDPDSGLISVATGANLDPDRTNPKQTTYALVVTALDGNFGRDQKQSQVIVNITVVDVNNKPPSFIEPGIVSVPEDAPIGFFVTRIAGKDLDDRPLLRYSIDYMLSEARNQVGSMVDWSLFKEAFTINSADGTIRVNKELDRETWDQVKLYLIVEDLAAVTPGQRASAYLTIKIADVNDNRPVFLKELFTGAITENAALGTPILSVKADDYDLNKTITYSLEGRKEILDLIEISPRSGDIVVKGKIDRETYSWINCTVRATDAGPSPLSSLSKISIQVFDENDNNPVFIVNGNNKLTFTAPEDAPIGSLVAQVTAHDDDVGPYGKVTYLLDASSSQGKFKIDRDTGSIIVANKLDREETSSYNLLIQAVDNYEYGFVTGESRRAFQQIIITISDVNDETPFISIPSGCSTANEFLPLRDTITVLTATDKDDPLTPNGRLKFTIVGGNEDKLFDIETVKSTNPSLSLLSRSIRQAPQSSSSLSTLQIPGISPLSEASARVFSINSLRARVGNYTLKVKVEDSGSPSRYSIASIPICISDVNDRSPTFLYPPVNHTIRLPENSTIGSPVIEVKAVDDDYGLNSVVNYKLRELPNGHWKTFKIDKQSGLITLVKTLDRERQRIYELRVEAFDLGEPTSLSTDLDITILITNVDDFEPEFTEDVFQVSFTENTLPGIESFKILPTIDKDEMDDPLETAVKSIPCYYIVGGNEDGAFKLDLLTHQLTVTRPLDRETRSTYSLIIQATNDCLKEPKKVDKFDPRDNSLLQVVINIKDVNDNPPKFVKPIFTGGVTTEADFGTVFMSVKAIDADEGPNAVVNYFIVGPQRRKLSIGLDTIKDDPFLVNRKTGEIGLNFDPRKDMKGYFEFQIIANDSRGLHDTAKVKIYLLREDQRVRFVLRLTPSELRERLEKFRDVLSNITGAIVNVDNYKFHSNGDGIVDKLKTDLYLHFVDPNDNSIMDVNNVLKLIDKNIDYLDQLYKDFNVLVSEPSQNREEVLTFDDQLKACLISSTAFLSLLLMLVTCLCINQRNRYERRLKAATATAFGHRDPQLNRTNVPNTNIHADEGSNPIWMTGYDNEWFKDDEQMSHNSNGNNSLDENAVSEGSGVGTDGGSNGVLMNGPLTPTDSLNESHPGTGSESSTNDKSALCRGVTAGRLTPQNITLPSSATNGRVNNNNKKNSQRPLVNKNCLNGSGTNNGNHSIGRGSLVNNVVGGVGVRGDSFSGKRSGNQLSCKNSINTVYISSPYSDTSQYHSNQIGGNNLSIINLETTEL